MLVRLFHGGLIPQDPTKAATTSESFYYFSHLGDSSNVIHTLLTLLLTFYLKQCRIRQGASDSLWFPKHIVREREKFSVPTFQGRGFDKQKAMTPTTQCALASFSSLVYFAKKFITQYIEKIRNRKLFIRVAKPTVEEPLVKSQSVSDRDTRLPTT